MSAGRPLCPKGHGMIGVDPGVDGSWKAATCYRRRSLPDRRARRCCRGIPFGLNGRDVGLGARDVEAELHRMRADAPREVLHDLQLVLVANLAVEVVSAVRSQGWSTPRDRSSRLLERGVPARTRASFRTVEEITDVSEAAKLESVLVDVKPRLGRRGPADVHPSVLRSSRERRTMRNSDGLRLKSVLRNRLSERLGAFIQPPATPSRVTPVNGRTVVRLLVLVRDEVEGPVSLKGPPKRNPVWVPGDRILLRALRKRRHEFAGSFQFEAILAGTLAIGCSCLAP